MPVDAERWLASRGIEREPVSAPGASEGDVSLARGIAAPPAAAEVAVTSPADVERQPDDAQGPSDPSGPVDLLDGSVASETTTSGAVGFIRRSTSNAPQSEGRLRTKLRDRGYPDDVIAEALTQARSERLVDDPALLAALIAERRARGHADSRLRRDLRDRGFTGDQVDAALERHAATDPVAAVFALAREQAVRHRAVDAEAAVRRTVGFLVRRGHSEALARKAARDAIYADREMQQVAGH
jgi:SOS response regulatory protein OraA/RecX